MTAFLRRLAVGRYSDFELPLGPYMSDVAVRGYYIDLREKAPDASWPPGWFPFPGYHRFIGVGQWGLAAYDRYLAGHGEAYLAGALKAGEFLVSEQVVEGPRAGGWLEPEDYPQTLRMRGPWMSAMAQGHCASLLVRLHLESGREGFAEAALRALRPYSVPTEEGGVEARLGNRSFPEEYPSAPPSYVLNGAIYAIWGIRDVAVGLEDTDAQSAFSGAVETLARNLWRWDLGYWSRYDLYPHPGLVNIASPSYHGLHVQQLRALHRLAPRPQFAAMADRFEAYAARRRNRWFAFAVKGAFRLVIPRRHALANRLPWNRVVHGPFGGALTSASAPQS